MNTITKTTEITIDTKPVRNKNAKPVYCISDGSIYASGLDAANAIKVDFSTISAMCRGKIKSVKGKQYCFVSDLPNRILDISNATKELLADANEFRKIDAERKAKEAHQQALNKLEEKIIKHKLDLIELQELLAAEEQMREEMERKFEA